MKTKSEAKRAVRSTGGVGGAGDGETEAYNSKEIKIPSGRARGQSHRADGAQVAAVRNVLSGAKRALWRTLLCGSGGSVGTTAPPHTPLGSSS